MTRKRTVVEAREYHAKEFLDFRRGEPTAYMEGLRFDPAPGVDPDERILSDQEMQKATEEGKQKGEEQ